MWNFLIIKIRIGLSLLAGQEAGYFCTTRWADTLSHFSTIFGLSDRGAFDGSFRTTLDAIAFEFHFFTPFLNQETFQHILDLLNKKGKVGGVRAAKPPAHPPLPKLLR